MEFGQQQQQRQQKTPNKKVTTKLGLRHQLWGQRNTKIVGHNKTLMAPTYLRTCDAKIRKQQNNNPQQ